MPPPDALVAVLPLTVLFVTVSVQPLQKMPPPELLVLLPLTVLFVNVTVLLSKMPPPKPAVLPLTVLLVNVSVEVTPLTMPPPAAPLAAVLPLTVEFVTTKLQKAPIPPPPPGASAPVIVRPLMVSEPVAGARDHPRTGGGTGGVRVARTLHREGTCAPPRPTVIRTADPVAEGDGPHTRRDDDHHVIRLSNATRVGIDKRLAQRARSGVVVVEHRDRRQRTRRGHPHCHQRARRQQHTGQNPAQPPHAARR